MPKDSAPPWPRPSNPNNSGQMIPQRCYGDGRSTLPPYLDTSHDPKPYLGPQPEVYYLACLFGTLPIPTYKPLIV